MTAVWTVLHIWSIVFAWWLTGRIYDRTKVALIGRRRKKNGLCPAYAVEGWGRHVDWCGRQTPNHMVHVYSNDPMRVHQQDAQLREQGL